MSYQIKISMKKYKKYQIYLNSKKTKFVYVTLFDAYHTAGEISFISKL